MFHTHPSEQVIYDHAYIFTIPYGWIKLINGHTFSYNLKSYILTKVKVQRQILNHQLTTSLDQSLVYT